MNNHKFSWIICDRCEGHGKVENPAFSNGFTSSEWSDMGPDDQDHYMRGDYDVICDECKGCGKVEVPNIAMLTFAEKRVLAAKRRSARFDAEFAAMAAAERRMGC